MSYRTTPNVSKIIAAHNAKLLNQNKEDPPCNCRVKSNCPLDGKCRAENVIYQATVTTEQVPPVLDTYIGMTTSFKDRFRGHSSSFENEKFKNQTTLSQHIWSLKDRAINFKVSWKIIGRAKSFSPVTGVCRLCTLEKFYLMTKPEEGSLNKNEEIYRSCLHKSHQLLVPKPKGKT